MKFGKKLLLSSFVFGTLLAAQSLNNEVSANEVAWEARTVEEIKNDLNVEGNNTDYTIQWGDTLSVIAAATNIDLDTLASMNNIANIDLIETGATMNFVKDGVDQVKEVTVTTVEEEVSFAVEENETTGEVVIEETTAPVEEEAAPLEETTAPVAEEAAPTKEVASVEVAAPVVEVASASIKTSQVPHYVYQVVESEAGPSVHEKKMVMSVILNRANNGNWGGTDLMSVVQASGQFEVHATGAAAAATPSQETINAVNEIMANGPITSAESFRATGDGVTNYFF